MAMVPARRRRLIAAVLALALLGSAVVFAFIADDRGSASVGVVTMIAGAMVAVLLAPDAVARVFADESPSIGALRSAVIDGTSSQITELELRLPREALRVPLSIEGPSRSSTPRHGPLASSADVANVFTSTGGRFAVIGEPGSGKTSTAIALCAHLLARAVADETARIPVYLRMAEWAGAESLEGWIETRVRHLLHLGPRDAKRVLPLIIPVLDGLDEVPASDRDGCARAIESFIGTFPGSALVVCCRAVEYGQLAIGSTGRLPAFTLKPLTATSLGDFFESLPGEHWGPLIDRLRAEPEGSLAMALRTPLMVSLTVERWQHEDPAELVSRIDHRGLGLEATRTFLWEVWFERASGALDSLVRSGAIALAKAGEETGAPEVRVERLGSPLTRWLWFLLLVPVVVVLTARLPPIFAVFPFLAALLDQAGAITSRFPPAWETAVTSVLLAVVGASVVGATVVDLAPDPVVSACIATLCAVLCAWLTSELRPPAAAWRHARDPFSVVPIAAMLSGGAFLLSACFIAAVPFWQIATDGHPDGAGEVFERLAPSIPLMCLYGLSVAGPMGLNFVGQHGLARLWHRWVWWVPFKPLVLALTHGRLMRSTGDSFRFFHLEFQSFLASRPTGSRVALRNIGPEGLWVDALHADLNSEHDRAAELWQRIARMQPNNSAVYCNLVLSLVEREHRREEALAVILGAHSRHPGSAPLMAHVGEVLRRMGRHDEAALWLERSLGVDANSAWTIATRGQVLLAMDEIDRALIDFDRALEIDPTLSWAREDRDAARDLAMRASRGDSSPGAPSPSP